MDAFEAATELTSPNQYWIEAAAGGSPAFSEATLTARFAYDHGARIMGWAAHGDECGGFPGRPNAEMKAKLQAIAQERLTDFPDSKHCLLFGHGGVVEAYLI